MYFQREQVLEYEATLAEAENKIKYNLKAMIVYILK